MQKKTIAIAAALLAAASVHQGAMAQCADGNVVIIGDSISAGYIPRPDGKKILELRPELSYANDLRSRYAVVNMSVGGADTTHALNVQVPATLGADPSHVVILLGVNDAVDASKLKTPDAAATNAVAVAKKFTDAALAANRACLPKVLFVLSPNYNATSQTWLPQYKTALTQKLAAQNWGWGNYKLLSTVFDASITAPTKAQYNCSTFDAHVCAAGHRDMGAKILAALQTW